MVSAISQHGILYDSNGVLIDRDSTIGNDSLSLTASQRKCLTDVLLQKKVDDEQFLKRTVFETLVQIAGVRQAFKVVKSPTVEQQRTEYKALEFLSHKQLFFIAYAQVTPNFWSSSLNLYLWDNPPINPIRIRCW